MSFNYYLSHNTNTNTKQSATIDYSNKVKDLMEAKQHPMIIIKG